jgi:hypothetical protein
VVPYPFVPKSTRNLEPGQFWAIPIPGGRFACGRVLQLGGDQIPTPSRGFLGGLQDGVGSSEPSAESIEGHGILDVGVMHIRAITNLGGRVLGHRALHLDSIELPILLSAMGGPGAKVLRGAMSVRLAEQAEWGMYPFLGYWGWDYIQILAKHKLG